MKRTQKEIKQQTEEWLDERWIIANMEDARPQDMSYYNGALKALEFAGYEWKRDADGKHTLFKQIGVMEMTKLEAMKCEKLLNEAIKNAENANKDWEKYLVAEKNKVALDMEINMRNCDYHRGYAEGINQALAVIGFKHERMAELGKLIN